MARSARVARTGNLEVRRAGRVEHVVPLHVDDLRPVVDLDLAADDHLDLAVLFPRVEDNIERLFIVTVGQQPPVPPVVADRQGRDLRKFLLQKGGEVFDGKLVPRNPREHPKIGCLAHLLHPGDESRRHAVVRKPFRQVADDPLSDLLHENLEVDQLVDHRLLLRVDGVDGSRVHHRP